MAPVLQSLGLHDLLQAFEEDDLESTGFESTSGPARELASRLDKDPEQFLEDLWQEIERRLELPEEILEVPAEDALESTSSSRRWRNYLNDHTTKLARANWLEPKSSERWGQALLERMKDSKCKSIKPVGSGHSSSDVAKPRQVLVDLKGVAGVVAEPEHIRTGYVVPAGSALVYVRAGTTVRALNEALWKLGLALPVMGTYDGQTVIGAISTGTHGSNSKVGPLAEIVRSVDIFVCLKNSSGKRDPKHLRIEARNGPTNAEAFKKATGRELRKSDKLFGAAVVSCGALGLVNGLIIEVRKKFWLEEIRRHGYWHDVQSKVEANRSKVDFYDLTIGPHELAGQGHPVLETIRTEATDPGTITKRNLGNTFFLAVVEVLGTRFLTWLVGFRPLAYQRLMDKTFQKFGKAAQWTSASYEVLRLGYGAKVKATSNELHFDVKHTVAAVNAILKLARSSQDNKIWHTSPIGVRFTAPSNQFIAMQAGRLTCSIEVPLLLGTKGGDALMSSIQKELGEKFGARPHWGQVHTLDGAAAGAMYPGWASFVAARKELDPFSLFANDFTDKLGLK